MENIVPKTRCDGRSQVDGRQTAAKLKSEIKKKKRPKIWRFG